LIAFECPQRFFIKPMKPILIPSRSVVALGAMSLTVSAPVLQAQKMFGVGDRDGTSSALAADFADWATAGVDGSATSYTTTITGNTIPDGLGGTITFSYSLTITAVGTTNNLSVVSGRLGDSGSFGTGEGFSLAVGVVLDDRADLDVRFDGFSRFSSGNTGDSEGATVNGSTYLRDGSGADVNNGIGNNPTWDILAAPVANFQYTATGSLETRFVDLQFSVGEADLTAPAAPTGLVLNAGDAQVLLDWADNGEDDLASYAIYRKSGGGDFAQVGTSLSSDYVDSTALNDTAYTYAVTALDMVGNESSISSEVSGTPVEDVTPPAVPSNLAASSGAGSVTLDWDDNVEPDLANYVVYRRTPTSDFIQIATTASSDYVDAGLINGQKYVYAVSSVDSSSNASEASAEASGKPQLPTNTPVQNVTQDQVTPVEVLGVEDLHNSSGTLFEDFIGFSQVTALAGDFTSDVDGDGESDFTEYKVGSDDWDPASRAVLALTPVGGAAPSFEFYQRLSSNSAYATVEWSTDLQNWSSAEVMELERTTQPDGLTEKVSCALENAGLASAERVFVRLDIGDADYVADFVQPPVARHGTAISMTARQAAFDPRTVEYYFECTSGGGNDSGWQRARMYIDSGTRTGDNSLSPETTYSYRVKTRQLEAPAVAGDPGVLIPDSESAWSREVEVTTPVAGTVAASRPNVIVFMCDDLGWEAFDIYGDSEHNTPRMTEMANEGMRFTHFYSQPLCTPSRVQIMSGRYANRNYTGFDNFHQNTSFGNFFQNAGYQTAIAGKWQLDGGSLNGIDRKDPRVPHWQGFDEYLLWHFPMKNGGGAAKSDRRYWQPELSISIAQNLTPSEMAKDNAVIPPGRLIETNREWDSESPGTVIDGTDYGPDLVNDFINDFALEAVEAGDNFFIYCPMILPHNPWPDPPTIDPNDPKGTRHTGGNAKYTMTEYMDHLVGQTLDMIRNHPDPNISQNTLVIFTSDNGTNRGVTTDFNGAPYRGAKRETRDGGNHVPCIVWWGGENGKIPTGQVCDDVTDISDVLATVCDAAGVPIWRPASVTGGSYLEYIYDSRSFVSALYGRNRDPRRWSHGRWEGGNNDNSSAIRWVRNQRYKLYHPNGKNDSSSSDNVNRSGAFFDVVNTPIERYPVPATGDYTTDESLPDPEPGSRLDALKKEFEAVLELMDEDIGSDTW
jgi:arylsulfatase A-like enzyme